MTNNWYLPVDLQASGWRMWPSLGWRWIRAVGREDKDEILSLSSWALLYQTTCLELEPGVHSVSTVNIAPSICWKKKNAKTFSQRKMWISIHLFFWHVICTGFQITTSYDCSTFTDLSEWCYYFEVVLFLEGFFCPNETRKRKREK